MLVNSCIFTASVCSTGSSCGQEVSTLLICQTFVANHAFSNASRSIYLFLAQWRHVLPWKCCFVLPFHKSAVSYISHVSPITVLKWYYHLLLSLLPWQWFSITFTLYHKIYELFYLWCQTNLKLQENGAINAQAAIQLKLQLDWLLCAISGFTSNDRAPGGPVTLFPYSVPARNCTGTTSANHGLLEAYIFTKWSTLYLGENAMGWYLWKIQVELTSNKSQISRRLDTWNTWID